MQCLILEETRFQETIEDSMTIISLSCRFMCVITLNNSAVYDTAFVCITPQIVRALRPKPAV